MKQQPIVAFLYDFDKTLCTTDMQDYAFIPSLGMTPAEFWAEANGFGQRNRMDGILAYMYTMLREAARRNRPFTRADLVEKGRSIVLFPGVEDWFRRINAFGAGQGVQVEHYIISSGLREIIEGSSISQEFKEIYASEFYYDESGVPVWPKLAVNFTAKTQFVYRINKGVLDVSNDRDLNASMPDDSKRVPFTNMIYMGDGLSDVPCMKMMRAYGGQAIAVYQGKADINMCLPFLTQKAESFSDTIISTSPNGIMVLNEDLEVQQINSAACRIMNIRHASDVLGDQVIRILDPKVFLDVMSTGKSLRDEKAYLAEYKRYVEQTVIYDKSYHIIICLMRDVTEEERERMDKEKISQQTIEMTDRVIEKQMRMAQEIASLLGETTAETKIALTKLKDSLGDE